MESHLKLRLQSLQEYFKIYYLFFIKGIQSFYSTVGLKYKVEGVGTIRS